MDWLTDEIKAEIIYEFSTEHDVDIDGRANWTGWAMMHNVSNPGVKMVIAEHWAAAYEKASLVGMSWVWVCRPDDWQQDFCDISLFMQLVALTTQPALDEILEWHKCDKCGDYHPVDLHRCPDVKRVVYAYYGGRFDGIITEIEYFDLPWQQRIEQGMRVEYE